MLVFTGVFGLGETFLAPTLGPLINSLTDDRIRGRANSISGLSTSLALIASPAIVTGFIAAGAAAAWIGLLCVVCLGTIGIGVILGRRLTREQDHIGLAVPAEPTRSLDESLRDGTEAGNVTGGDLLQRCLLDGRQDVDDGARSGAT